MCPHARSPGRVSKVVMKYLIVCLLAVAVLSAPQGKQTFTGTITDDECGRADHSRMRMGPTDAECVLACISAHSASYVLYDGKDIYTLSDQRTPERFAGQKVTVVGALDAKTKTIQVESDRKSTRELQSQSNLVCRLLLEKKKAATDQLHPTPSRFYRRHDAL